MLPVSSPSTDLWGRPCRWNMPDRARVGTLMLEVRPFHNSINNRCDYPIFANEETVLQMRKQSFRDSIRFAWGHSASEG